MDSLPELLGKYPRHHATVPLARDSRDKRRRFKEASDFTRQVIFTNPYDFRTIVITGTNGKGSTGSILSTLFRQSNNRVGVISSPATRDNCTDMVRVNGDTIPAHRLLAGLEEAEKKLKGLKGHSELTHYMPICVAAYDFFREQRVDVVVAETAIGGMGDPTVPFKPDVCVFTNITREHENVLGDTLAKIARHKSQIIGQGSRVVLGEEITDALASVISSHAHRQGSSVVRVDPERATSTGMICDRDGVKIFNGGNTCPKYQHTNLRLAVEAFVTFGSPRDAEILIDLDDHPPGIFPENRFELRTRNGVTYLFDAAHNEDAYLKLATSLARLFDPAQLSFFKGGFTQDSVDSFCRVVRPHRVTFVSGYHPRVFAHGGSVDLASIDFDAEEARVGNGVVVICGMFLASKVKSILFPEDPASGTFR